jgi:hypothetical protein
MFSLLKKYMPGTFDFMSQFFDAMNNKKGGHSLRKWLAVGFYWLMFILSMKFTTSDNIVAVLTIHASMITALVITYTTGNYHDKKNELLNTPKSDELKQE